MEVGVPGTESSAAFTFERLLSGPPPPPLLPWMAGAPFEVVMVALLCLFRGVGGFRVKGGCFVVVVFELVF